LGGVDTDSLIGVISALAPNLTDAQLRKALADVLKQFAPGTNPAAFRGLARTIQALPLNLTDAQVSQALDPLLKQMGNTSFPPTVQALG
jgi:hypothetical protein